MRFGSQGHPKILEATMRGSVVKTKGYSKFEADASVLQDIGLKNFPKTKISLWWINVLQNKIAPVEKVARVIRIAENENCREYATKMPKYGQAYNVGDTVLKMLHQ